MDKIVYAFKALADSNRIRILKMLEIRPLCVCEITEILNLATSTVSKHLSILRNAEFITDEKDGKWVNYYLNTDQTNPYMRHLLPLIRTWLTADERVLNDQKKVTTVDRNTLCGI
ncbi:MAG: metalloregulator ArsR/SmtB family transcription factor [Caldithrix sp.]|nr:metalloregulator ArsR/SmtB family transcription factor [Caldithrix sp.]